MRRHASVLWLTTVLAGCGHPLQIVTHDAITVDSPVITKVAVDLPPVADAGPLTPVSLGNTCIPGNEAKIAVVDVDGLLLNTDFTGPYSLGENPMALFREKLDAVAANPAVKAVILRINSPGGSVTASDVMRRDLRAFKDKTKVPVVACILDVGAGGAYYLASATDVVIAHPTSLVGGIGVILNLYNVQDLMAMYNVAPRPIKAGSQIDMGSSSFKLEEPAKTLLQTMANEFHQRFEQMVMESRPHVERGAGTTFDGRIFTARQALERKLIDQIGYVDDAVAVANKLAGLCNPQTILMRRPNDPAHSLYAISPNTPLQATAWPINLPGFDRSRLPTFLYLWEPEATIERLSGK